MSTHVRDGSPSIERVAWQRSPVDTVSGRDDSSGSIFIGTVSVPNVTTANTIVSDISATEINRDVDILAKKSQEAFFVDKFVNTKNQCKNTKTLEKVDGPAKLQKDKFSTNECKNTKTEEKVPEPQKQQKDKCSMPVIVKSLPDQNDPVSPIVGYSETVNILKEVCNDVGSDVASDGVTSGELRTMLGRAERCLTEIDIGLHSLFFNLNSKKMWRHMICKHVAMIKAILGKRRAQADNIRYDEAIENARLGIHALRIGLISTTIRKVSGDKWVPQTRDPEWIRARKESDDVCPKHEYGIFSMEDATEAYEQATDIVEQIVANKFKLASIPIDSMAGDEQLSYRRMLCRMYLEIKSIVDVKQAEEMVGKPMLGWQAQSGYDAIIRKLKIDERISASTYSGLGRRKKQDMSCKSKCFDRHTTKRAELLLSSSKQQARVKISQFRDEKRLRTGYYEAQIGLPSPSVTMHHQSPPEFTQLVTDIHNIANDGITMKIDLFSKMLEVFKGFGDVARSYTTEILLGVSVAYLSYRAIYTPNPIWLSLATISMLIASYMITDVDLIGQLKRIFGMVNEPQSQDDGVEAQSSKDNVVMCTLMYVYSTMFRSLKSDDKIIEYIRKTSDVPKWANGVHHQIEFFLGSIQKFLDWLTVRFDMPEFIITQQPYPDAHNMMLEIDKMVSMFNQGADLNYDNGMAVYGLQKKAQNVLARIPSTTSEGRDARKAIEVSLAALRPIVARLARANIVDNGPRVAPVGVMICGPSGIGKTDMMEYYMNAVTAHIIPENKLESFRRNHNDVTYSRHAEVDFWDGYHGQFNVYIDDIGQTRDVAGNTNNEYMEAIRMIGPGCYGLNMAHLDDKGNTHFRSKMVYSTSNQKKFNLQSLHFNEPFCRRWTISYVMTVKEEFAAKPFQKDPWSRRVGHFPSQRGDMSYAEFYPIDLETGDIVGVPISYEDLCALTIKTYRDRYKDGETMMRTHQSDKERHINARLGIKAQSGEEVRSSASIYHSCKDLPPVTFSESVRETMPTHLTDVDQSVVLGALAQETGASSKFVVDHVEEADTNEGWYVLIATLKNMFEEARSNLPNGTSLPRAALAYLSKCNEFAIGFKELVVEHKKKILAIASALGVLKLCYSTLFSSAESVGSQSVGGHRMPAHREYSKPTNFSSRGEKFKKFALKPKRANRGHMQLRGDRHFDTQAGSDGNAVDIIRKVIRENQYFLRMPASTSVAGKITFIKPWIAIAPLHFGERLQYGVDEGEYQSDATISIWSVVTPNKVIDIPIEQLEIIASEFGAQNDWCLIRIPKVIERTRDILHRWAEDTALIDHGRFRCTIGLHEGNEPYLFEASANVRKGVRYEEYDIANGFEYNAPTKLGHCGSLLVQSNKAAQNGKLIGIHTAGAGSKGFGPRIVRSDIEKALRGFDGLDDEVEELELDQMTISDDDPPGFRAQCNGRFVNLPGATNIRPTPLNGIYKTPLTKPAYLRPVTVNGQRVDPMELARLKYSKSVFTLDPIVIGAAKDLVTAKLTNRSLDEPPWHKPRIFSFREAVEGMPGVPFMEGIPRNTSPGYPYRLDIPRGHKGKSHFFGSSGEYDFSSEFSVQLEARVDKIIELARDNKRCLHVYTDFLKDERRPIDKVNAGKTRLVSASPIDLLIAHRMYFMDFVRWVMSNRITNGSAVGVNCYSSEWQQLANELLSVSSGDAPCIIAGDYSGFDGSIGVQIQYVVLDMINAWYDDEHSNIRRVLWEDICSSRHITGSTIYQWSGSNPSGCFMTTILNTIVNSLLVNYAYVYCFMAKSPEEPEDSVFGAIKHARQHMRYVCFGDDNLVSVSKYGAEVMTQSDMTMALSTIGYTYTAEDKGETNVHRLRRLEDVSFLKRSFYRSPQTHQYMAPLELDVVLEMPMWTSKKDDGFTDAKVNVDTALRELSLHSKDTFRFWAPLLVKASAQHLGYSPTSTDQAVLRRACLNQERLL